MLGVHGLKGTLIIYSGCRSPGDIFRYGSWWLGSSAKDLIEFQLERGWTHGRRLLARLKGIEDRLTAGELRGCHIWVPERAVDAASEGEYFWVDLIGCEVWNVVKGELLGSVAGLQEFGAQDILCVRTPAGVQPSGEWLLPFVDDVILHVNISNRRIDVRLPDGMEACFTPRS